MCAVAELVLAEKVAYLRFANGMTDQPNPTNNSFLNLSLKKSIGQAVGLYLFGLLVLLLANFIVGSIAGTLFGAGFNEGLILGAVVSIAVCPLLAFWILKLKSLLTPLNIVLALIAGVLALFGGALLGLIPSAYFATLQPHKKPESQ